MMDSLGKGEVESSILSCSTINPNEINAVSENSAEAIDAYTATENRQPLAKNWQRPEPEFGPITVARFWSKVEVLPSTDDCWAWRAHVAADGYGKFRLGGVTYIAHRIAWQIVNGPIAEGLVARHKCDNRKCCNPFHLELGTQRDNMADMVARGRGPKGAANPRALLSEADVAAIKARIASGEGNMSIARDYPVSHSAVSQIRLGKTWA